MTLQSVLSGDAKLSCMLTALFLKTRRDPVVQRIRSTSSACEAYSTGRSKLIASAIEVEGVRRRDGQMFDAGETRPGQQFGDAGFRKP